MQMAKCFGFGGIGVSVSVMLAARGAGRFINIFIDYNEMAVFLHFLLNSYLKTAQYFK